MKKGIKSLVMSIVAIVVSSTMLLGTTYAYFTDSVSLTGNKIVAGTLGVDLELLDKEGNWKSLKEDKTPLFNSDKWEPGYTDVKVLKVENEGTLPLKWKATFKYEGELSALADVIDVYVLPSATEISYPADNALDGYVKKGTVREFTADIENTTTGVLNANEVAYLGLALKMQNVGNMYQGLKLCESFDIAILATQLSGVEDGFTDAFPKLWDGTIDTSWYNETDTTFTLTSAKQFAGFASLVDGGNTFEGKTIVLGDDVDLNGKVFDPIGSYRKDMVFKGTFDGNNHVISNLAQNTWALDNGYYYGDLGLGLFGAVEGVSVENPAVIKNLVIDGADISGETALCGTVAAVAGDNVIFENITVKNAKVADYQYYAGGIVGWAGGDEQFINCTIDASTTIGAQWGEFNNANGGVIGGVSSEAEILLKDCTIACRIDAFNDVTSAYEWGSYRRSGMIIGDSGQVDDPDGNNVGNAIAPNLTCENVTVIYGEWANYHYCQFNGMGYPWVRVEEGTSNGAYSNPRYGHPTDANGNKVVDENHVHNDDEKHNEPIVFDQLYGGKSGDRYCTYGTATHDGVTVIYNNK